MSVLPDDVVIELVRVIHEQDDWEWRRIADVLDTFGTRGVYVLATDEFKFKCQPRRAEFLAAYKHAFGQQRVAYSVHSQRPHPMSMVRRNTVGYTPTSFLNKRVQIMTSFAFNGICDVPVTEVASKRNDTTLDSHPIWGKLLKKSRKRKRVTALDELFEVQEMLDDDAVTSIVTAEYPNSQHVWQMGIAKRVKRTGGTIDDDTRIVTLCYHSGVEYCSGMVTYPSVATPAPWRLKFMGYNLRVETSDKSKRMLEMARP